MLVAARFPTASSALQRLVIVFNAQVSTFVRRTDSTNLILSVEIESTFSVEAKITQSAALVSTPREHGQRNGNGDINTNLTDVHFNFEFTAGSARLGEDCSTVTVVVVVDDVDCIVQVVGLENDQDGTENLLSMK